MAARAEPVITGQLAKMKRRIGSVRGGRVLLATGSVAWQGVCALSRVTWWIARTSTPRAVKRRLRRAWIVLTTPRGWAERLVDPFWRAKYGQLSPREQWIVAFLLGMWEPIVEVFAKEPPPRRVGDRAERPSHPTSDHTPHDEGAHDMSVEIEDLRELGEELAAKIAAYARTVPMSQLGQLMSALTHVVEQLRDGVNEMATALEEERPANPAVVDALREMGNGLNDAAQIGDELETVFEKEHAPELERLRNPRVAEEEWDKLLNEES